MKGKEKFLAGLCKDQQKLVTQQKSLTEKYGIEFVGLSLNDTVQELLNLDEIKLAEKLRAEYKVSISARKENHVVYSVRGLERRRHTAKK